MAKLGGPTVLLATTNEGKRREFRLLLPAEVRLLGLDDIGLPAPAEQGVTFRQNADAKALHAAARSGLPTLADDSGLVVDALGGAPGVRSARFAGDGATDAANRDALLLAMAEVAEPQRRARFVCVVSLAQRGTILGRAEGTIDGQIGRAARGYGGFGYDSLFLLPDGRTMAELPPDEKNRLSHRAAAYRRILPFLLEALKGRRPQEASR